MINTSRSKIVAPFVCPRYRYLKYHYGGKGLQRVRGNAAAEVGKAIHQANALSLRDNVDYGVNIATGCYKEDFSIKSGSIPHADYILKEQLCMIEGAARAFARCRLPKLLEGGYKVLNIEDEMSFSLAEDIRYHARMDVVLLNEELDLIKIVDFKPCSYPSPAWVRKWERDPQILAYIDVAESLYQKRAEGMQIEGYVKGSRRYDKNIMGGEVKIQNSPLCYVYVNKATGEIRPTYQAGLKWEKQPVWEVFESVGEYIDDFLTVEDVEKLFLVTVPPIAPNPQRLARWRTQTIHNERLQHTRADRVETVRLVMDKQAYEDEVDKSFPQNFDACYKYGLDYPCEMSDICYNGQVEEAPLESGLYEEREDHHGGEGDEDAD